MNRKPIVKVVLSKEQKEILDSLTRRLGLSHSEVMRTAFMEYAKSLGAISEFVQQKNFSNVQQNSRPHAAAVLPKRE